MARYPKIRRKDLRKPDEFITFTHTAVEFARANAGPMVAVAAAVGLLVVAATGLSIWRHMQESAANVAFVSARDLFAAEKFPQAQAAFERVANSYSHTGYGHLSLLYAADSALAASDYQKAAELYERFLAAGPDAEYLRQAALVRLGRAQAAIGKPDLATKTYKQAQEITGPFSGDALLGEAQAAEQLGDSSTATRLYREFIKTYPNSDMTTPIQQKLAKLNGSEPAAPSTARPPS